MVYLGLQDDDELDYSGEYEAYGDYAEPAREPREAAAPPRAEYDEPDNSRRAAERPPPRRDSTTVKATRDVPAEPDPLRRSTVREEPPPVVSPRPSVVRTIGPTTAARVHVLEPSGFGDAPEVGDRLKASQPVILNLQGLPKELQRRLIDFSSGLAYALGARMERVPVSDPVFLLTPTDVEVSQEEKERLQARGLYQT
jgi:cell division inhibitor SepF